MVKLITETSEQGVKLTKKQREKIEEKIERLTESTNQEFPDLGQWFIDIYYDKSQFVVNEDGQLKTVFDSLTFPCYTRKSSEV